MLILSAMVFSPASYVAPMRESSILIAALLSARFLVEKHIPLRLLAASGMVIGVILLALAP
ncbi:MAG: hypothetical protein R2865_08515 [Deinococcales bacterium]